MSTGAGVAALSSSVAGPRRYSLWKDGIESKEAKAKRLGVAPNELPFVKRIIEIKGCGDVEATTFYKDIKSIFGDDIKGINAVIESLAKPPQTAQLMVDKYAKNSRQEIAWKAVFEEQVLATLQSQPLGQWCGAMQAVEAPVRQACEGTRALFSNVVERMGRYHKLPLHQAIVEEHYSLIYLSAQDLHIEFIRTMLERMASGQSPASVILAMEAPLKTACQELQITLSPESEKKIIERMIAGTSFFQAVLESRYLPFGGFSPHQLQGEYLSSLLIKMQAGQAPEAVILEAEASIRLACDGTKADPKAVLHGIVSGKSINATILSEHYKKRFGVRKYGGQDTQDPLLVLNFNTTFTKGMLTRIASGHPPSVVILETEAPIIKALAGTPLKFQEVFQKIVNDVPLFLAVLEIHYGFTFSTKPHPIGFVQGVLDKMVSGQSPASVISETEASVKPLCEGTKAEAHHVVVKLMLGIPQAQAVFERHYEKLGCYRSKLLPKFIQAMIENMEVTGKTPAEVISAAEAHVQQVCTETGVGFERVRQTLIQEGCSLPEAILRERYRPHYGYQRFSPQAPFIQSLLEKMSQLAERETWLSVIEKTEVAARQECEGVGVPFEGILQKLVQGASLEDVILKAHKDLIEAHWKGYPKIKSLFEPLILPNLQNGMSLADAINTAVGVVSTIKTCVTSCQVAIDDHYKSDPSWKSVFQETVLSALLQGQSPSKIFAEMDGIKAKLEAELQNMNKASLTLMQKGLVGGVPAIVASVVTQRMSFIQAACGEKINVTKAVESFKKMVSMFCEQRVLAVFPNDSQRIFSLMEQKGLGMDRAVIQANQDIEREQKKKALEEKIKYYGAHEREWREELRRLEAQLDQLRSDCEIEQNSLRWRNPYADEEVLPQIEYRPPAHQALLRFEGYARIDELKTLLLPPS
jgi:hypothetical protein